MGLSFRTSLTTIRVSCRGEFLAAKFSSWESDWAWEIWLDWDLENSLELVLMSERKGRSCNDVAT